MRIHLTVMVLVAAASVASAARAETCSSSTSDTREVCKVREIFLMPGIDGVAYAPNGKGIDPFVGAGFHIAPFQWSHNTDSFGPGQGAIFLQVSLLRSMSYSSTMALVEGGTTLSFEKNASRTFLIPYFGGTMGEMTHAELTNSGYGYPFVGVHGIYTPHLMLDVQGGYMFPFTELDTLRGVRGEAVMRVSMW